MSTQINGASLAVLQTHRQGGAISDFSEALQRLTREVLSTGRPGSVTLKLTLKPATRAAGALTLRDEVKIASPKPEPVDSIFFGEFESGALLRDNPSQMRLPMPEAVPQATVMTMPAQAMQAAGQ